ncbi:CHAT domain-containing protein [Microcoleus sp. FACHB-672]|uniref:CHAT domain-containing protein n=1 Tax=Microcoleus sp. FACHB-672 TaxID=2692825 RepID=UPI001688D9FE|nr:CHAT domain-containing protein [Microcoleus sp. FACHB-672]MBD2042637.1 CHAT domain-containing protein [Microcoleus sp. FACHB-672]
MNESRLQACLNLIQQLQSCPSGEREQILADNEHLIDKWFLLAYEFQAEMMAKEGQENGANFFRNLVAQIREKVPDSLEFPEIYRFLIQILLTTSDSNHNSAEVYPLLEANLEKLNPIFAQLLRDWATQTPTAVESTQAHINAVNIVNFSILIQQFPLGSKSSNLEIAIAGYKVGLSVFTRLDYPNEWAMTQTNLGTAYSDPILAADKPQNIKSAIACHKKALQVYKRQAFSQQWAMTQNNLGTAYYSPFLGGDRSQNLKSAIGCFKKALQVYKKQAFPQQWAKTQHNLGTAYSELIFGRDKPQNIKSAIACFKKALQVYNGQDFPENHAEILFNLGCTYQENRKFEQAYNTFVSAIYSVEFLRSEIYSGDERKKKLAEEWNKLYRRMVEVCLELGKYTEAIEYVERSKARNLVELLAIRDLYPKGQIPEDVRTQLQHLRQKIEVENRRLAADSNPNNSHLNYLREEYNRLFPFQPIDYPHIQELLDNRTAIIEWYLLGDAFLTFVIAPDSVSSEKKSISHLRGTAGSLKVLQFFKTDFDALIAWGNNYLNHYLRNKEEWKYKLAARLQELALILHLDEILACLAPTIDQLVLVPHLFMHVFPLHALQGTRQKSKGKSKEVETVTGCLLDLFAGGVKYAPSCQLLQQAQSRQRSNLDRLFAIQNPTEDLYFTDIEVESIQLHFNAGEVWKKKDACKTKFEQLQNAYLPQTHCAHFSCHGYFNFKNPLLSALLLANCYIPMPEKPDPKRHLPLQEGRAIDLAQCLTLADIISLDLSACRLVFLSACETGITDLYSTSDEYISLLSGFLIAGSPSVVGSLWKVNDLSTALLTIRFYQNLKAGLSVTLALNTAQIWLRDATKEKLQEWTSQLSLNSAQRIQIKAFLYKIESNTKPFESPYFWAAFCAIGQ